MLDTNLKHIESREEIKELLKNNANVMVCCGRMGPMCIPVYGIMEKLESEYSHVRMVDMDFDIPVTSFIRNLPECSCFMGLPFILVGLIPFLWRYTNVPIWLKRNTPFTK